MREFISTSWDKMEVKHAWGVAPPIPPLGWVDVNAAFPNLIGPWLDDLDGSPILNCSCYEHIWDILQHHVCCVESQQIQFVYTCCIVNTNVSSWFADQVLMTCANCLCITVVPIPISVGSKTRNSYLSELQRNHQWRIPPASTVCRLGEKFGSNSSGLPEQIGTNKWKKVKKHLGNALNE